MITFGIAGLLLISYGLWIQREKRQNIVFMIGGACLLAYSIFLGDIIFVLLQCVFIISALLEFIKLSREA